MSFNLQRVATRLAGNAFVVVPVLVASTLKVASQTSWEPTLRIWLLAIPPGVLGFALLDRGTRARRARQGRPVRPGEVENEVRMVVSGLAALVLAECIFVVGMDWRIGVALFVVAALWVLLWVHPSRRSIEVTSFIDVRCDPQAAFEYVSNPNNWPAYAGMALIAPVEVPVHVGTVVRCRMNRDLDMEADEEVVEYEPGKRRFATAIVGSPSGASGTYTFEPVDGGTRIEYTFRNRLMLTEAAYTVGLERGHMIGRMRQRRAEILQQVKALLEGPGAATV